MSQLKSLRLTVSHIENSIKFYIDVLGMHLVKVQHDEDHQVKKRAILSYDNQVHPFFLCLDQGAQDAEFSPQKDDLYWKIGIALADVELARNKIMSQGISVSQPNQFLDIGYLCHLQDPDGFVIELLQYTFGRRKAPLGDNNSALGQKAHIGQVSLRVKNIKESIDYYQQTFGLRLISKMDANPYGFSLYFLAPQDAPIPPQANLEAVENREWLWSQPITTLELLHREGSESLPGFSYKPHSTEGLGFKGLGFSDKEAPPSAPEKVNVYEFTEESF